MTQSPQQMLSDIAEDAELTAETTGFRCFSEIVMDAIAAVPRDAFVGIEQKEQAWYNIALPIGCGQTISQPYMVALMTELLQPQAPHRCLEIGTGSGWQAAVLSQLVKEVYSTERIDELRLQASRRLQRLGFNNVHCVAAEAEPGYARAAPYDSIIVTAAAEHIPPSLPAQLRPGGRMVIPVGPRGIAQQLLLITSDEDGEVRQRSVLPVRFVPLIVDDPPGAVP